MNITKAPIIKDLSVIPEKFPLPDNLTFDQEISACTLRYRFSHGMGMWAFVAREWTDPLAEWIGNRRCLEVMAGVGYLSRALADRNVNIISTDDKSWNFHSRLEPVHKVLKIGAVKSVEKYGKRTDILIMSWPYMDNTAFRVIRKLNRVNPEALIIYIGEGYDGCTANNVFFNSFQEIEDNTFSQAVTRFRSWPAIHDRPYLGKYKSNSKIV